ncbi:MAG: DEAD/DEAH box helicase [Desulfobacteraceae bacterium]|nr:MAG: DEAD/DEAH box helicase [Desulfobacteraceae bacterium]
MKDHTIENRIEFFRNGVALFPEQEDPEPGVVIYIRGDKPGKEQLICSCGASAKKTCRHKKEFSIIYKKWTGDRINGNFDEDFLAGEWNHFSGKMFEISRETAGTIQMNLIRDGQNQRIEVLNGKNEIIFWYYPQHYDDQTTWKDEDLFMERCWDYPGRSNAPRRINIMNRIALFTMTETERAMQERGVRTRRQAMEESFWYKAAYHCYRTLGNSGISWIASVDDSGDSFFFTCRDSEDRPIFQVPVARDNVPLFLSVFKQSIHNKEEMTIHPIPLKSIVRISLNKKLDLVIQRYVRFLGEDAKNCMYCNRKDLEKYRFGTLFYLPGKKLFAKMEEPDRIAEKMNGAFKIVVKNERVPLYLDKFGEDIWKPPHLIDDSVRNLKIFKNFDSYEVDPLALERDWYWISLDYQFGNSMISLREILQTRKKGNRFIAIPEGWVDCRSLDINDFLRIPAISEMNDSERKNVDAKVTRFDLYRIFAASDKPLVVSGTNELVAGLNQLLETRPSSSLPELKGMASDLREYQKLGVEWLMFLFENRFGGLLCDDMGLGKTHQVMAFMVWLSECLQKRHFLVVCPTTVLSHWESKIKAHAPGIKASVYYGTDRKLSDVCKNGNVILTSYGILRRDISEISRHHFSLAVFDEAQNIKNAETQVYAAVRNIQAEMKLCVTGTPIENRLSEIKALMDVAVPDYLGTDNEFQYRFAGPIENNRDKNRQGVLSRLIKPFTIRRLKQTVLDELPEKIEDIRTCRLSADQVKLYNDAVASNGLRFMNLLQKGDQPIPYIHIFALLNLLKQICNHPVMIDDHTDDYGRYESGKWELFKELLSESLESGQKVVVYSQFLKMISMIKDYIEKQGIGCVALTGSSKNRGELINRFNHDSGCRVFVGSLKAGGAGIDLVAASVVIHYDRWWNAAKEDQATDRVHRIGQNRGVQVFKLVTEGTLEEKISAIIEKKRNLMDSVIQEDDTGVLKTFSREQLIDILSFCAGDSTGQ